LKHKTIILIAVFLICGLAGASAMDFGASLGVQFKSEKIEETVNSGIISLAPWFYMPIGEADLNIAAGVQLDINNKKRKVFVPELFRLEFSAKPIDGLYLKVGRFFWKDASQFTAKGNFDGVDAVYDLGIVRVGAAALYTGLLYKDTANINVSPTDPKMEYYFSDFKWSEIGNTFYAPRRLLLSVYGDFPGLPIERGSLQAGLLFQFDCSKASEKFHTQYFLLRDSFAYKDFDGAVAGALGLEKTKADGTRIGLGFTAEGGWQTPAPIKDRLSLGMIWASGETEGKLASYYPVVVEPQGIVMQQHFSSIMAIKPAYEARIMQTLSAILGLQYYFITDAKEYLYDNKRAMGLEVDGTLMWVPFSDLSFNVIGGLFFPKAGNVMKDEPVMYSITIGGTFSF